MVLDQIGLKFSFCLKRGFFGKINCYCYCLPIVAHYAKCLIKILGAGEIMGCKVFQFRPNWAQITHLPLKEIFWKMY